MTDAQFIFDAARQQYNQLADGLERHFESVATQVRGWLPQHPPPPPPRKLTPITYWKQVERWISNNSALSAGIAAFVSTGAVYLFIQRKSHSKKRRARKSNGGARTEVVGMFDPIFIFIVGVDVLIPSYSACWLAIITINHCHRP